MRLRHSFFLGLLAVVPTAYADKGDIEVGVGYGFASFEFKEPEFTSDAESLDYVMASGSWSITHIDKIRLTWRQLDASVGGGSDAEPNTNGLTVEGDQIVIDWQHNFRLSRYFKPWIGAGIVFNQYRSFDKFSTDSEGYAIAFYEDRDEQSFSVALSAALEYELFTGFSISPQIGYDLALGDGPSGLNAGVFLSYKISF